MTSGNFVIKQTFKWLTSAALVFGGLLAISTVLTYLFVPIAYDTAHLQDTMFFADLGWRILNGATPTSDFEHFYGGVIAQYVYWSFLLFGITVKSIDYAILLLTLTACSLASIFAFRRLSLFSFSLLLVVIIATQTARVPLEWILEMERPTATHSFLYNKFGLVLALSLSLFALVDVRPGIAPIIAVLIAVLAGITLYLVALTKPTFVIFIPTVLLALVLQNRFRCLFAISIGILVAVAMFDPFCARFLSAFSHLVSIAGEQQGAFGLILKSFALLQANTLHPILFTVALTATILTLSEPKLRRVLAMAIVFSGCLGMAATMGWRGSVAQQLLPVFATFGLVFFENLRANAPSEEAIYTEGLGPQTLTKAIAACLAMAFFIPQLTHSTMTGLVALNRTDYRLFETGPLSNYVAWNEDFKGEDDQEIPASFPLDQHVQAAEQHLMMGRTSNAGLEYTMLADGVRLLERLPNISDRRIVGEFGGFSFALQSKPVNGYPVWVHKTATEFKRSPSLPSEVDIVILRRLGPTKLTGILKSQSVAHFRPCLASSIWEVLIRNDADPTGCDL